jgi:hypothetical protein
MKTQWEYDLVEKPFCEQLKGMGWDWLEGDTDVPELTERENFREVLLKGRLAAALRKLNLRGGRGTPLNNSFGMKGDRTIRKGLCGDQPALTLQEIGEFPGCSRQPSGNKPG